MLEWLLLVVSGRFFLLIFGHATRRGLSRDSTAPPEAMCWSLSPWGCQAAGLAGQEGCGDSLNSQLTVTLP